MENLLYKGYDLQSILMIHMGTEMISGHLY